MMIQIALSILYQKVGGGIYLETLQRRAQGWREAEQQKIK